MCKAENLDDKNLEYRHEYLEKRRRKKCKECVEERNNLIEMEKAGMDIFNPHTFNNSGFNKSQHGSSNGGSMNNACDVE